MNMTKYRLNSRDGKFYFFRFCEDCKEKFRPIGRCSKYCEKCQRKHFIQAANKRNSNQKYKYEEQRDDKIRDHVYIGKGGGK